MSTGPRCVIEVIEAANQSCDSDVIAAVELMASITEEEGEYVLTCERCMGKFALTTELGDTRAQFQLAGLPTKIDDSCNSVRYRKEGDWATNLSSEWFTLDLLRRTGEESQDESVYSIAPSGLEIVLNRAARKVSDARRGSNGVPSSGDQQLPREVRATAQVLDLAIVRQDGKTLTQEIVDRSQKMQ